MIITKDWLDAVVWRNTGELKELKRVQKREKKRNEDLARSVIFKSRYTEGN